MSVRRALSTVSVAVLLGFAGPGLAADVETPPEPMSAISGQIDGWVGYWFQDGAKENVEPTEDESLVYGIDGRLRLDLVSGLSIQADASFDDVDENRGDDYHQGSWMVGGHLSWSDPESGLLGVFGGVGTGESDEDDTDFWFAGLEGQLYWDQWTLYGQVGHFDAEVAVNEEDDAFHNAWFGRLVGRYFFTPEDRLQGEFSYANGDQDTDDRNMDVFGWGARYDHRFMENIGVFVAYDGGYFDNGKGSDSGSYYDHVIRGGISVAFGRPDLFTADRSGPNLDMPWVGRWASSGQIVD